MSDTLQSYLADALRPVFENANQPLANEQERDQAFNNFIETLSSAIAESVSRYILRDVETVITVTDPAPGPGPHTHIIQSHNLKEK